MAAEKADTRDGSWIDTSHFQPAPAPFRHWSNFPLESGNGRWNEMVGFAHFSVITHVFILEYTSPEELH